VSFSFWSACSTPASIASDGERNENFGILNESQNSIVEVVPTYSMRPAEVRHGDYRAEASFVESNN
jgi:hypothetical protein